MTRTSNGKTSRTGMRVACLVCVATLGGRALAGEIPGMPASHRVILEGSAVTALPQTDGYYASVYIYAGGSFPVLTNPTALQFLFGFSGSGDTSAYITPLLFEAETFGEYTVYIVRGIGQGFEVSLSPLPQTLPFNMINGVKLTSNGNFTFGFINALVDTNGTPIVTSQGAVEYTVPANGGHGEGGARTTNDWFASETQNTAVPVGTTFGLYGSGAADILFSEARTYAARASGIVSVR